MMKDRQPLPDNSLYLGLVAFSWRNGLSPPCKTVEIVVNVETKLEMPKCPFELDYVVPDIIQESY